jgi:hypothetical protein
MGKFEQIIMGITCAILFAFSVLGLAVGIKERLLKPETKIVVVNQDYKLSFEHCVRELYIKSY